jgi:L-glyceraldehyde reductase
MSFGKTLTLSNGATIPRVGFGTWQSAPGEVGQAVCRDESQIGYSAESM